MADRSIASRPSMEQVVAIINFMEKHPRLALGQLRGLEGRERSKKLWFQLTRIVNGISGPTRPMKSWIKFWADKKSTVRAKVMSLDGDLSTVSSHIEKKIWDLFLAGDHSKQRGVAHGSSVKQEGHFEDPYMNENSMDGSQVESDAARGYSEPVLDAEDRQMAVMEKLVAVMKEQSTAMSQLAAASGANAQAVERLAEASHIQAQAFSRMANAFETMAPAIHGTRSAILDIDVTLKRLYNAPP